MENATSQEMPRPPSDTVQIAIRVPADWLEKADKLIPQVARPGVAATRTDVFRVLISRGFAAFAAEEAKFARFADRKASEVITDVEALVALAANKALAFQHSVEDDRVSVLQDGRRVWTRKIERLEGGDVWNEDSLLGLLGLKREELASHEERAVIFNPTTGKGYDLHSHSSESPDPDALRLARGATKTTKVASKKPAK